MLFGEVGGVFPSKHLLSYFVHYIQLEPVVEDGTSLRGVFIVNQETLLRSGHADIELLQLCAERTVLLVEVRFVKALMPKVYSISRFLRCFIFWVERVQVLHHVFT